MKIGSPAFLGTVFGLLTVPFFVPTQFLNGEDDLFRHLIFFGVSGLAIGTLVGHLDKRHRG